MKAQKSVFFRRNPWTVFALTLVTAGFYAFYWFYKQWVAVEKATGTSKFAVVAAIFYIYTSYNLFRHIVKSTSSDKKQTIIIPLLGFITLILAAISISLSTAIFTTIGGWVLVAVIFVLYASMSATLAYMQFLANKGSKKQGTDKSTGGEKAMVIIGLALAIPNIVLLSMMVPGTVYLERVAGLDSRVDLLDRQAAQQYEVYEQCDAKLQEAVATVETYDEKAVAAYLEDAEECDELYQEYSDTLDEMNALVGQYFWAIFR
jgi:hypothetical protein